LVLAFGKRAAFQHTPGLAGATLTVAQSFGGSYFFDANWEQEKGFAVGYTGKKLEEISEILIPCAR
jgi:hypothetical protein